MIVEAAWRLRGGAGGVGGVDLEEAALVEEAHHADQHDLLHHEVHLRARGPVQHPRQFSTPAAAALQLRTPYYGVRDGF
jgi:hypothetical protein